MQDLTPASTAAHAPAARLERLTRLARFGGPALATTLATALAAALVLAGCGVTVQNRLPAEALARQSQPAGTVYTGWRVFQDKCARCHGADATGSSQAPDLTLRVRDMGERRFMALVLSRYDWALPAGADAGSRDAQVEAVLQRQQGALRMPAWQGEPVVTAHISDLYAYLAARADGSQGADRPQP